jgi:hypothetical protein
MQELGVAYRRNAQKLCAHIREELLVPYCETTGLEFHKNGTQWYFCTENHPYYIDAEKLRTLNGTEALVMVLTTKVMWDEGIEVSAAALMESYCPTTQGRVPLSAKMQDYLEWGFVRRRA